KIFQPISATNVNTNGISKDIISKSQQIASKSAKLMTKFGLITSTSNGYFTILPLAQRSVEKCVAIVDYYMKKVDAQKISVPILTSIDLWKKSGRYEQGQQEVLTTKNSDGKMYVLGPV
ncbi:putative proline--tRNA ligase, mitochondrial, partial [Pseudolycoriella hygida]